MLLRKPVCFVLTPFGTKIHPDTGISVDFDEIYEGTVRPALHNAGMDPLRIDQAVASLKEASVKDGVMRAEFALADITTRDPAILFLLGARAERMPSTTLVLATRGSETQLAGLSVRVLVYELDEGNRLSHRESLRLRKALSAALSEMRGSFNEEASRWDGMSPDAQERSVRGVEVAQAIEAAGYKRDPAELKRLATDLLQSHPDSPLLNVFQAYGNLGEWQQLAELFEALPPEMQKLPRVRQQAALALNRLQQHDKAVAMLSELIREQGPDSETLGLLGRVYKDLWFKSKDPASLDQAIGWYVKGFDANRKDAYPGINAVTLLEIRGDADSRQAKERLLPFVMAAVQDQIKQSRRPNFWDYATLLELAVLAGDESQARSFLGAVRGANPESWQTETTCNNLELIRDARAQRGEMQPWLDQILLELRTSVYA